MTKKTAYESMCYERGYKGYTPIPYDAKAGVTHVFVKQFLGGEWLDVDKCPLLTCLRYCIDGHASWLPRMIIPLAVGDRRNHQIQFDQWPFTDVEFVSSIIAIEANAIEAWRRFNMHDRSPSGKVP